MQGGLLEMIGFKATYSDGTVYEFKLYGPHFRDMSNKALWLIGLRKACDACPRWAELMDLEMNFR